MHASTPQLRSEPAQFPVELPHDIEQTPLPQFSVVLPHTPSPEMQLSAQA